MLRYLKMMVVVLLVGLVSVSGLRVDASVKKRSFDDDLVSYVLTGSNTYFGKHVREGVSIVTKPDYYRDVYVRMNVGNASYGLHVPYSKKESTFVLLDSKDFSKVMSGKKKGLKSNGNYGFTSDKRLVGKVGKVTYTHASFELKLKVDKKWKVYKFKNVSYR